MLSQKSCKKTVSQSSRMLASQLAFRLHPSDFDRGVGTFYECLDTPKSLACHMLYKYGEHAQLVNLDTVPGEYIDVDVFRRDFAATSFLRKHPGLKTGVDLKSVALASFEGGEQACEASNTNLRNYLDGRNKTPVNEWILSRSIRFIGQVLGRFLIDDVIENCGWGPGVTLSVKGSDTSGSRKFDVDHDVTIDAYDLYGPVMTLAYPSWDGFKNPRIVRGNEIITVRKNAKTDRTIAIEPGLNSWIQKGIGRSIRERLRQAGFNLDSDWNNQMGAYKGSIDDSLATIDFKAASDSIAIEAVKMLLPREWYQCLDAARSKFFKLDGVTRVSKKFSTMGNGFTFELESLIFLALAVATCDYLGVETTDVAIFGDDLILPKECVEEFTIISTFMGFKTNPEKSFSSGPFRESCGVYFFNGVDVKPMYLKSDVKYARDLFKLVNAVRLLAHRHAAKHGCDGRLRRVWSLLVHYLPASLRLFGAVSSGDGCLHGSLHEAITKDSEHGWCGVTHACFVTVPLCTSHDSHSHLLARLKSPSKEMSYGNDVSLRGKTRTAFKKSVFVSRWYDFGAWT